MSKPYEGPIVDAHHHLWDLRLGKHPWLQPGTDARGSLGDLAPLRRNYLPADYLADTSGHNVVASVHVEAGWMEADPLGETDWLATLDRSEGIAARWVACAQLADPAAPALIEAQSRCADVVGIRDSLSWDAASDRRFAARADLMADRVWRDNLARLAALGLSFDLMIFPSQLADAVRLARHFPELQFVLNHCGSPIDRDPDGMALWRHGLRQLGREPNVAIKISDLVAYDHHWSLESLRSVILTCIDCFGPKRAMFASDFPVAGLHASFDQIFGAFKMITADFAEDDQSALFEGTARRIYRVHA